MLDGYEWIKGALNVMGYLDKAKRPGSQRATAVLSTAEILKDKRN